MRTSVVGCLNLVPWTSNSRPSPTATSAGRSQGRPDTDAPVGSLRAHEEHRVPVLRALATLPALPDALGLRRPPAVDRPGGRGRGARRGRGLLPRAPLRPPALLALPAARGDRRAHQPDR